ncbi:Hpt domain-containing protein [Novosphingobium sp.]|uniref:Hpt domain-containing protein n=1 Tax=Novosphingobium sp. TaxID=1874826 RepID=UPI00333F0990
MAYLGEAIDAHLVSALGDDPALLRELRRAFLDSALAALDLMERARCDANWRVAAERIKGLAATFHGAELITLADEAIAGVPGDRAILRNIRALLREIDPDA